MVYFKPQAHGFDRQISRQLAKTFGRANARKLVKHGQSAGGSRIGAVRAFDPRGTPFEELPSVPPRQLPPKPVPFEPERFPSPKTPGWALGMRSVSVVAEINAQAGWIANLQELAMTSMVPAKPASWSATGWSTTITCKNLPPDNITYFASADLLNGCFNGQVITGTRFADMDPTHTVYTTARQVIYWCNSHFVGPTEYADYSIKFKRSPNTSIPRPIYTPAVAPHARPWPVAEPEFAVHPHLDPNSQPIFRPLWVTTPLPFWSLPYRQPNPARVSPERTEFGNVAPDLVVRRDLNYGLEPTRGVQVSPDTGTDPVIRPPDHQFADPGPGVKERKTRMSGVALAIWHGINWVSEAGDFIEAMYYSLPKSRRSQIRRRLKHKPSQWEMAQALYTYGDEISLKKATINIIEMEIGDYIVGQQAQWLNKAAKPFIEHIRSPLGIQSLFHLTTGERVPLWSPKWKDINHALGLEVEGY